MPITIVAYRLPPHSVRVDPLQFAVPPMSLDDASRQLPEGAYTTFRTYHHFQALSLDDHLSRLELSARLTEKEINLSRPRLREALRESLVTIPYEEARIRITLDLTDQPGTVYLVFEPLVLPTSEQFTHGVAVATVALQRENPRAKLTGFIQAAELLRREKIDGVYELLMIDPQGRLLEGLSSNFFAVSGGQIWTAGESVLAGVTRSMVLHVLEGLGLDVLLQAYPLTALRQLDEAFMTSSSRGVLPVTAMNGQPIGTGVPGPITREVMADFHHLVESELELI